LVHQVAQLGNSDSPHMGDPELGHGPLLRLAEQEDSARALLTALDETQRKEVLESEVRSWKLGRAFGALGLEFQLAVWL
jgi:hypothetical protein